MLFGKDVRRMADAELSAAVRRLIQEQEAESITLDYKETINVDLVKDKKELAKDVSSLANEQGGMLIYGVPEEIIGGLPRPKPLLECGMDIPEGLPERIENTLQSTVQPPLHALTISVIELPDIQPKKLLLVHHPESYWKPHMVQGHKDGRYYRRCNFSSVPMTERQVEALYRAREASRRHAMDFFEKGLFGPVSGVQVRAVACPVMPGHFKETMVQPGFRNWLADKQPLALDLPMDGQWLPFLDGWRFVPGTAGAISGKQYETRVFHNGAVCLNLDPRASSKGVPDGVCFHGGALLLDRLGHRLQDLFVRHSIKVFEVLRVTGPIVVRFSLFHAQGLKAAADAEEHMRIMFIRKQISEKGTALDERAMYTQAPTEPGHAYADAQDIVFDEETCAEEMAEATDAFVSRLINRLGSAFGL